MTLSPLRGGSLNPLVVLNSHVFKQGELHSVGQLKGPELVTIGIQSSKEKVTNETL